MTSNHVTPSGEFHPELLQIEKSASVTLSSLSYDGNDLISFEDRTCATELSSRPASATSFLDDNTALALPNPKANKSQSVYVMISGTSYSVPKDVFDKLQKLNWAKDRNNNWKLDLSPAIFEILLGYILFETLPAIDTLSKTEYDEFEPLAISLELYDLIVHFDRSSDKRFRKCGRRSLKQKHKGTPIILNSEDVSVASIKLMAANSKCARFIASLKRKGSTRLRARRAKTTHAQWIASGHVN